MAWRFFSRAAAAAAAAVVAPVASTTSIYVIEKVMEVVQGIGARQRKEAEGEVGGVEAAEGVRRVVARRKARAARRTC